jgi:hypothetical protein
MSLWQTKTALKGSPREGAWLPRGEPKPPTAETIWIKIQRHPRARQDHRHGQAVAYRGTAARTAWSPKAAGAGFPQRGRSVAAANRSVSPSVPTQPIQPLATSQGRAARRKLFVAGRPTAPVSVSTAATSFGFPGQRFNRSAQPRSGGEAAGVLGRQLRSSGAGSNHCYTWWCVCAAAARYFPHGGHNFVPERMKAEARSPQTITWLNTAAQSPTIRGLAGRQAPVRSRRHHQALGAGPRPRLRKAGRNS